MALLGDDKAHLLADAEGAVGSAGSPQSAGPTGATAKEALLSLNYWLLLIISSSYVGGWESSPSFCCILCRRRSCTAIVLKRARSVPQSHACDVFLHQCCTFHSHPTTGAQGWGLWCSTISDRLYPPLALMGRAVRCVAVCVCGCVCVCARAFTRSCACCACRASL